MTAPYDYGTVATFTCDIGYAPSALTRVCEGEDISGVWSGTAVVCTGKQIRVAPMYLFIFSSAYTCLLLPSISNGVISYSGDTTSPFAFGTLATYSCNDGFYLAGVSVRTCIGSGSLPDGFWLGTEPECLGLKLKMHVYCDTICQGPI